MASKTALAISLVDSVLGLFGYRTDGWRNPFTGYGTERDRTNFAEFCPDVPLTPQMLSALFHGDDIAKRICRTLPREMTRLPFRVLGDDGPAIERELAAHNVRKRLRMLHTWARVFGGAVLYLGVNDGQPEYAPVDLNRVGSIARHWRIYDARRAWPHDQNYDPEVGPRLYRLMDLRGGVERVVHVSRLIVAGGADTGAEERLALNSWDYSVLQACWEPLRQFNQAHKSTEIMMSDASQGVLKIRGLIEAIRSQDMEDLKARAALFDVSRSVARAVYVDADGEDFSKQTTPFSGVGDVIDRFSSRLAAASELPVTLLMGQAPAGLNATGNNDVRAWYDVVRAAQEQELGPELLVLARFVAAVTGRAPPTGIEFASLWQESPRERAEREELEARADQISITTTMITPRQAALRRFGPEVAASAPDVAPTPPAGTPGPGAGAQPPRGPRDFNPATPPVPKPGT